MEEVNKQFFYPPPPTGINAPTSHKSAQRMRNRRQRLQRRERIAHVPCTHQLMVPFHSSRISVALTVTLWKHLLYARGLFPIPAFELFHCNNDNCDDYEPRRLPRARQSLPGRQHPAYKRKINCAQQQVMALEKACEELFKCQKLCVKAFIVSIGSTWCRPREVYALHWPADVKVSTVPCNDDKNGPGRLKLQNALSARLIRTILAQEQEYVAAKAATTTINRSLQYASSERLYVTVAVTEESYQAQFELSSDELDINYNTTTLESSCTVIRPTAPTVLLPSSSSISSLPNNENELHARHSCKILERCLNVQIVSTQGNSGETTSADNTAASCFNDTLNHLVWFSLSNTIKGFRL